MNARLAANATLAALALLLVACGTGGPGAPPPADTPRPPVPSPSPAPATALPPPIPSAPPGPAKAVVNLVRDGAGWRLDTPVGYLGRVTWLGDSRLLVTWSPYPDVWPAANFLADLAAGQVMRLPVVLPPETVPSAAGAQVIALQRPEQAPADLRVDLVALPGGEQETVFASDPAVAQWTAPADRRWDFGAAYILPEATWVGPAAFVLTLVPQDGRNIIGWGKVLLVDVAARQVRTLAERGQVALVLPDGSLLLRPGWVDGPLQVLAPPYTGVPTPVAPGGPWTWGWAAGLDGRRAAWFELDPPPGDWSARLPYACCSGDPVPTTRALVLWDRTSGSIARVPVTGVRWPWDMALRWRQDSSAVLYTTAPLTGTEHTSLLQMGLDGRSTLLADPAWPGPITVYAETADGSLYLGVGSGIGSNGSQLVRRHPDGRLEVLREGIPLYTVVGQARLVSPLQGATTVEDLARGTTSSLPFPGALLAPGGRWAAGRADDRVIRIVPLP